MKKCKIFEKAKIAKNITNVSIIKWVLILILIIIFVFSCAQVWVYVVQWQENERIKKELSVYISASDNTESEIDVDFKILKEKNKDTVGFLRVKGTGISCAVVKSEDNNYYLGHNFYKNINQAGWIFADYRNKFDGSDKNIVIYGHSMKNGSMFATLENVLDPKWQNNAENHYIDFITENEKSTYQVFSTYQIETKDYYNMMEFLNNISYEKFLDKIKSRSNKDFGVKITSRNKILTLSTCVNDGRRNVVLHAKKI